MTRDPRIERAEHERDFGHLDVTGPEYDRAAERERDLTIRAQEEASGYGRAGGWEW